MVKVERKLQTHEVLMSLEDFLKSYNKNMPPNFPRASIALLMQFENEYAGLFKRGHLWSLDLHRKKVMDWLPRNSNSAATNQ